MDTELKAGDTVRLKSSGPLMTVESITADQCKCTWFDDKMKMQSASFPLHSLNKENADDRYK